jgi:hypothetical protein
MIYVTVDSIGKESVTKHQPFLNDDQNDTLLFEKLREHILTHYPNPEHIGCPTPEILKKLINTPRAVGLSDLNDLHIFKCAECTRALMELRKQREQVEQNPPEV